jgi:hypothetical protein
LPAAGRRAAEIATDWKTPSLAGAPVGAAGIGVATGGTAARSNVEVSMDGPKLGSIPSRDAAGTPAALTVSIAANAKFRSNVASRLITVRLGASK